MAGVHPGMRALFSNVGAARHAVFAHALIWYNNKIWISFRRASTIIKTASKNLGKRPRMPVQGRVSSKLDFCKSELYDLHAGRGKGFASRLWRCHFIMIDCNVTVGMAAASRVVRGCAALVMDALSASHDRPRSTKGSSVKFD